MAILDLLQQVLREQLRIRRTFLSHANAPHVQEGPLQNLTEGLTRQLQQQHQDLGRGGSTPPLQQQQVLARGGSTPPCSRLTLGQFWADF